MATTVTAAHDWVKWSVRAGDVIVDPFTGACSFLESPEGATGEQIACHACGEPLTDSSAKGRCEGP